jgi:cytochrome c oxidase subunit II
MTQLMTLQRLWFPDGVSTYAAEVDRLFYIILVITGLIFVIVNVALIYIIVRYRHREGRRAHYIHGNTRAEVIWTAIPFVIVIVIAGLSMGPWLRIRDYNRFPPADIEIAIAAKQFEWNVTYPGPDGRLGTEDDFTRRNQLHLPVGRVVHVHLTADDVIHSFFLPEFRVKQDAVPGMSIPVWFEATTTGTFALGCAELCGLGHYRMRGTVTVHEQQDFDDWARSGGTTAFRSGSTPAARVAAAAGHTDHADHTGHTGH